MKIIMWFSGMNMMAPNRMCCALATLSSSYDGDVLQLFAALQIVHFLTDRQLPVDQMALLCSFTWQDKTSSLNFLRTVYLHGKAVT
jgi:hypothetical protein